MDLTWLKKIKYKFQKRALVLMYHSINTLALDPWELAVSPENFEQQLEVLKKFRVVAPSTLAREIGEKKIRPNTVSLTFDDAYEDNFSIAKPLLEKYSSPAIFFISTHFIGRKELFWWDELAHLILETDNLPGHLSVDINGEQFYYALDEDASVAKIKKKAQLSWLWHQPPPTKRCVLYLEIWKLLKPLEYDVIRLVLERLFEWSGQQKPATGNYAMDNDQLQQLRGHPLIQTGIHCVTHPALSNHNHDLQKQEIKHCRNVLESSGHQADLIAYPYGDFNNDTITVAKELGLSGGFTTLERVITHKANILKMGRFQVRNVDGETFEKQLLQWFTTFPASDQQ